MTNIPLKCSCGTVTGVATDISPQSGTRLVCYCDDCQAFAQYLHHQAPEKAPAILNDYGGTDIFQLTPAQITITAGHSQLRALKLTPKGLIRWYTACCHTPVGNTIGPAFAFVGMPVTFMQADGKASPEKHNQQQNTPLGPIRFHINTEFAQGTPPFQPIYAKAPPKLFVRVFRKLIWFRLKRLHKPSPFFDAEGKPVSAPITVSEPSP